MVDERLRQEAARYGMSVEAYLRAVRGRMGVQAMDLPAQRPFGQGPGPGGDYGGGQGQMGPAPPTPGIGAVVSPAADYRYQAPDHSIWGQLKSHLGLGGTAAPSGVPWGTRLSNVGAVLSALADPQGRSLAPTIVNVNDQMAQERAYADQKAAYYADLQRQQQMAESLYNNLKDTNPQLAEAIRSNPSLVQDYMKGQIDLNKETQIQDMRSKSEMALEKQRETGALGLETYKTEHDPKVMALKQWKSDWKDFIQANGLDKASTVDVYRAYYKDPNLTENEAQRIASANLRGGQEAMDAMYSTVIDDRTKGKEVTAAEKAAALAGVHLSPDTYLTNVPDIISKNATPQAAIVPGTKSDIENQVAVAAKNKSAEVSQNRLNNLVTALDNVVKDVDSQTSGESMTGAGYSSVLGYLPVPTNAYKMATDLRQATANISIDQLQSIRQTSVSGGGLGNVSNYEDRMLGSTEANLYQGNDPAYLRAHAIGLKNRIIAFNTPSSLDSSKSVLTMDSELLVKHHSPAEVAAFEEHYGPGSAALIMGGVEAR